MTPPDYSRCPSCPTLPLEFSFPVFLNGGPHDSPRSGPTLAPNNEFSYSLLLLLLLLFLFNLFPQEPIFLNILRHRLLADASASYPTPTLRSTRGCSCCCLYYLHIAPLSTTTTRSPTVFFYAPPGNNGLRLSVWVVRTSTMCCCLYPRVLLHARHAEWCTSV